MMCVISVWYFTYRYSKRVTLVLVKVSDEFVDNKSVFDMFKGRNAVHPTISFARLLIKTTMRIMLGLNDSRCHGAFRECAGSFWYRAAYHLNTDQYKLLACSSRAGNAYLVSRESTAFLYQYDG